MNEPAMAAVVAKNCTADGDGLTGFTAQQVRHLSVGDLPDLHRPPATSARAQCAGGQPPVCCLQVRTSFTIYAADASGARLRSGGATFKVVVRGQAPVKETITDQRDGTYLVQLTYPQSGKYEVAISHNFNPIQGSPFSVQVQAARRPAPPPPPRLGVLPVGAAAGSAPRSLEWDPPAHNGGMPIEAYRIWSLSRELTGGKPTLLATVAGDIFQHDIPGSAAAPLSSMCAAGNGKERQGHK